MATDGLDRAALILTAGAIGFCVGEWLGPGLNDQRIQWETLITGFFAVAAAAWSVRAALRLDKEQERRHREMYRLTLRADRLRVQRAQHPASIWLRQVVHQGGYWLERYEKERGEPPSGDVMDGLIIEAEKLMQSVQDSAVVDAQDLFDAIMTQRYRLLQARVLKIKGAVDTLKDARIIARSGGQDRTLTATAALVVVLSATINAADGFADDLTKLAIEYTSDAARSRLPSRR